MSRARKPVALRALLVGAVLLGGSAGVAQAHGGAFVAPPPPPATPPWLRGDPYNPRPTPTSGPRFRRPVTQGGGPPPTAPPGLRPGGSVPPVTTPPPATGFPGVPPPSRGPTGSPPPTSLPGSLPGGGDANGPKPGRLKGRAEGRASDWTEWWDLNADALRSKDTVVRRALTGEGADEAQVLRHARTTLIIPLLRSILTGAHGTDPDILASAALALGKTTDDPKDIDLLVAVLRNDETPRMTRECAALALGLLRRTDAAARFDGLLLDRVRTALFEAFDDDAIHVRARCFAALAIGLLGDQPSRPGDAFARDGRLVTQGLWTRLKEDRTGPEATVALLVALGLQPAEGVPQTVQDGLRSLAVTGRLDGFRRGATAQAHAVMTLARVGGADCAGSLLGLVKGGSHDSQVRRSSVVALGWLAPRLDARQRKLATDALLDQARRGDPDTAGLSWISVSRLLAADGLDGSCVVARETGAHEAMLDAAGRGNSQIRPYAALAVGLLLRSVDAPCEVDGDGRQPWKDRALAALRGVADDDGSDPDLRGAFVIGLGLARDVAALPRIGRLAARTDVAEELRAHACAGIGLLARSTPEALAALHAALAQKTADHVRREAARALGTLGDVRAVPSLVAELRSSAADHVRARAAVALGEVRASGSVGPLSVIATDKTAGDLARAVAIAALGLVGDPETVRSITLLGSDTNYHARTDALIEALGLL